MKQFIASIAIIIAMIAVFFIVDRKDWFSCADVLSENHATSGKLAAASVPEINVIERNPGAKSESNLFSKTALATETRFGSEPQSEDIPIPMAKRAPEAVPVATPEEAEKANNLAIFLSAVKTTIVEGVILERSVLPDPVSSDYPDCRFTAHFIGNAIRSGESCPKEISLVIEGFENYCILPGNNLKNGDKVLCAIFPFEQLPEDFQSTQQADDLRLFLLDSYYVLKIDKISSFSQNELMPESGILFSDDDQEYVSIFERHINPPITKELEEAQRRTIEDDLRRMDELLKGYDDAKISELNIRFEDVWKKEKEKDSPGYNRISGLERAEAKDGKYVWRNLDDSFWSLPEQYLFLEKPTSLSQETLNCFTALKKSFESNGVQIIVSIVPNMYVVSSRVINREFRDIPDLQTATYAKQLSEIGIETIYATDAIVQNYNRYPFAFFYPDNGHPSETAQDVLTDLLAERLKRYDIKPVLNPDSFSEKQNPRHFLHGLTQYRWPFNCDISSHEANTAYSCRQILYDGKKISSEKESSIIIFGNSFMVSPMLDPGTESFPTLVSLKTLSPIDWHRANFLGVLQEALKQCWANPEHFLKGKKVAVFCFGENHLGSIDSQHLMFSFSEADHNRKLLNKKKAVLRIVPQSNTQSEQKGNDPAWDALQDKVLFEIGSEKEVLLKELSFDEETSGIVDPKKDFVLVVQAVCSRNHSCVIRANDRKAVVPSYSKLASYHSLLFEFPAGTKTITIKAEGPGKRTFAVKDFVIYQ